MPLSLEKLKEDIEKDFKNDPLLDPIRKLASFFEEANKSELRLITINHLSKISGIERNNGQLLRIISILTSPALPYMQMCFLYSDGEKEYEVSNEEVAEARETGFFINPETGQKDEEYENHFFPYFKATKEFLEIRS